MTSGKTTLNRSILLILAILPLSLFAQPNTAPPQMLTNYESGTSDDHFSVILQSEKTAVIEYYHNWKSVRWMISEDTIVKQPDGTYLTTTGVKIDVSGYYELKECDPIIDPIRNEARMEEARTELTHRARAELSDALQYERKLVEQVQADSTKMKWCHGQYAAWLKEWKEAQFRLIDSVTARRSERLELIRTKPEQIDTEFIKNFLKDYANCMADHTAMYEIMKIRRDEVMLLFEENRYYFDVAQSELWFMPSGYARKMLALVQSYDKQFPLKSELKRTLKKAAARS